LKLFLFHTAGCHLCELAQAELNSVPESYNLNIELCDIAESEQWMQEYDVRIPVIKLEQSKNDLGWPFTATDVIRYLDNELSNLH
jgi:hypothetical protein